MEWFSPLNSIGCFCSSFLGLVRNVNLHKSLVEHEPTLNWESTAEVCPLCARLSACMLAQTESTPFKSTHQLWSAKCGCLCFVCWNGSVKSTLLRKMIVHKRQGSAVPIGSSLCADAYLQLARHLTVDSWCKFGVGPGVTATVGSVVRWG